MTDKKRKWWKVQNEIICKPEEVEVPNRLWQELFDACKGFQDCADSHFLASSRELWGWKVAFLAKMVTFASCLGHWKRIVKASEERSPDWERTIKEIWNGTRRRNILYRWEELRRLLPKGHPYLKITKERIRELKGERREKSEYLPQRE